MKFLVILICLTINYLWLKDFDRFDDTWFFRLRRRIESAFIAQTEGSDAGWMVPVVFIYAVPMLALAIVLWTVDGWGFGLPTMVVHILVVLVAFDRTQPGKLASEFLSRWRKGDVEGSVLYMRQENLAGTDTPLDSQEQVSAHFKKQLVYRCFEKMFVMFFWYLLTGAMGVLFNYVSYQLRDSHAEDQDPRQVALTGKITYVLEWAPVRMLALTFSLAGNFVQCFERVKLSFWEFEPQSDSAAILYGYAGCALSGHVLAESADNDSELSADEQERLVQGKEIEALQALLERSQAIWLAILALMTIFGLQSI